MPRYTDKGRGIGARGGVGKPGRTAGYKFFEDPGANPADPILAERAKALWGDPLPNLLKTRAKAYVRSKYRLAREADE